METAIVFTIGYQSRDPRSFVETLQSKDIECLVDVRQRASSRKRGFAKTALRELLSREQIGYEHLPALGPPPELRDELKAGTVSRGEYLAAYRRHLPTQRDQLNQLLALVRAKRCCLMCLESNPEICHRSVLAEELARLNPESLEVDHIT